MKLTGNTRIGKLIERYPFLIEFLGDYAQEFQMLRNAVMRKTVARFATLDKAAGMARIDRDQLLRDVAGAIARETGETVEVDAAAIEDAVDAERVETLKQIVTGLHEGKSLDEVKAQFAALAEEVSPAEIAAMEQRLVQDGIAPEEIKRLCDVHVAVFKDALAGEQQTAVPPGHPVDTFKRENEALGRVIRALRAFFDAAGAPPAPGRLADAHRGLAAGFERLGEVDKHYLRKEHQLFPQLEKHGITAPPKVMWAVHDDIRAVFKQVRAAIEGKDYAALATAGPELLTAVDEMVYKEENILFPMSLQVLSERDWVAVR
ncbi:MAG TPA: DUF438 domain-containing protein, partial [Candidatus Hydrogenedentes bacterium]|nr:DUF438 domain-containing protein [Candidatus Hydrogenedentota bacterium]